MARIRNNWTGRPRNVSRQEYNHYSLLMFGTAATGGIAVICFIASLLGLTTIPSKQLADLPTQSVEEALQHQGDRTSALKFQGQLVAEPPLIMPDDPNLEVVTGQLTIEARSRSQESVEPAILFDWQKQAPAIYLEQDGQRLPFGLDVTILPLEDDRTPRKSLVWEGESARISKAIAVEYAGQQYPFPEFLRDSSESPRVTITRNYFLNGQPVVIVAGLETTEQGPQLVPPLGKQAQVWLGTESDIKSQGEAARPMLFLIGIGSAIACYFLNRQYRQAKDEIIRKSNQP